MDEDMIWNMYALVQFPKDVSIIQEGKNIFFPLTASVGISVCLVVMTYSLFIYVFTIYYILLFILHQLVVIYLHTVRHILYQEQTVKTISFWTVAIFPVK